MIIIIKDGESLLLLFFLGDRRTGLFPLVQLRNIPLKYSPFNTEKIIVAGTSQYIAILSLKTGDLIKYLFKPNKNIPIRYIKLTNNKIYAAYQDGEITAWDL